MSERSPFLPPQLPVLNNSAPTDSVLRGCANLCGTRMEICQPWSFISNVSPSAQMGRAAFARWATTGTTEHLFFTAFEGIHADRRVNRDSNPIHKLHGLIVHYDAEITDELVERQLARIPTRNLPTWVSRPFRGGVTVVWLFEEPIVVGNDKLAGKVLELAAEELTVRTFLPGLYDFPIGDLTRIYEVGRNWRKVCDLPLEKEQTQEWLFRVAKNLREESDNATISLEVIAKWVEQDYPGRWDGPFKDQARGCVFFDSDATNEGSAIITKGGMICPSQPKIFYPWAEIFGISRIRKYGFDNDAATPQMRPSKFTAVEWARKLKKMKPWTFFELDGLPDTRGLDRLGFTVGYSWARSGKLYGYVIKDEPRCGHAR